MISAGGALAGRVSEVGPNFAHIVLISDSTRRSSASSSGSAATGVVRGQLGGALVMVDVDSAAEVTIGEEVFTAGIELGGGIRSPYPKGLLIGRVVDVKRDPNEVVQTVFLEPAAPLDRLEFLLVITDYEGGISGPHRDRRAVRPDRRGHPAGLGPAVPHRRTARERVAPALSRPPRPRPDFAWPRRTASAASGPPATNPHRTGAHRPNRGRRDTPVLIGH